jgi:hypothetical protein
MADSPRRINFRLPQEAYTGLTALITHSDALSYLVAAAVKVGPGTGFGKIAKSFSDSAKIPLKDAEAIVTALWNLFDVRRDLDLAAVDLVAALTAHLEISAVEEWRTKNLANWKKIASKVEAVVDPDSALALVHKSVRLTYAHQNVLVDAEIITDLRPVFSNDGQSVRGAVVSHQLVVEYHDGVDSKRLHVVMDAKDIEKLLSLCKRAEVKAKAAKSALSTQDWITAIAGSEETKTAEETKNA